MTLIFRIKIFNNKCPYRGSPIHTGLVHSEEGIVVVDFSIFFLKQSNNLFVKITLVSDFHTNLI
jgi:hypothetical protein